MVHSELEEAAISYARAVGAHARVLTKIAAREDEEKDEDPDLTEKALKLESAVCRARDRLLGVSLTIGRQLGILR